MTRESVEHIASNTFFSVIFFPTHRAHTTQEHISLYDEVKESGRQVHFPYPRFSCPTFEVFPGNHTTSQLYVATKNTKLRRLTARRTAGAFHIFLFATTIMFLTC